MATELAQAYVQIIPSADGIAGNLENLIGKEIEGAGSHVGNIFSDGFSGALGDIVMTSAEIVTSVVDLFSSMTESISQNLGQMATYGDGIDKLSQKLGISAEALQEWDFIAQHSGTSIEALRGSFKLLSTQAQNGAEEFEKLGLSLDEVGTMSTEDLFGAVIEGLQGMEAGTERTAIASKLLGRGATELGALLNMSAEDTEEMRQRVHELGGVLSDEAVKDSAAYKDSLQDLMVSFNGLKNNLVSEFLPAVTGVMDGMTALITGDESGLTMINEGISEFITKMAEELPNAVPIISSILLNIGDAIIQNLPIIIESGGQILMQLATGMMEQLPLLLDVGLKIINQLGTGIGSNISGLLTSASGIIVDLVQMITDPNNMAMLLEAGLSIIEGLANGVIESIPIFIDALSTIINNLADFFIDSIPTLIETAVKLVLGIVAALPKIIESLVAALPSIIESVTTTLITLLPLLIDASIQLIQGIVDNLPDIIHALIGAIPTIIESIVNALVELTPVIVEAGFNLFVALIENADSIITEILTLIPEIIDSLVGVIEDNWDTIAQAGFELIVQLVEKTPEILSELAFAVGDICVAVLGYFEEALTDIKDIGWNLIEGFINGAKDAWAALKDGFLNIIDGAVESAKQLLGIASPSKVFKEIGGFVVEGFDEGVEGLGDSAVEQTQQMIKDINSMAEDGIGFDAQSALNSAFVGGNVAVDSTNNYLYNLLAEYLPEIASGKNINISLEGDADGIFNIVRQSNNIYRETTDYNPLVSG